MQKRALNLDRNTCGNVSGELLGVEELSIFNGAGLGELRLSLRERTLDLVNSECRCYCNEFWNHRNAIDGESLIEII